jgi:cation:H+ antiporter
MDPTLYIKLAGGLVYLLAGGDLLVRGAVALARRFHVSPMVIGLTVVAFGTSLPELVVVLRATLTGYPGLMLGNVVGSNIANVFLVAGVAAIVYPLTYGERSVRRDSVIMVAASIALILLCSRGVLTPVGGAILVGGIVAFTAFTAREAARAYREADLKTPMEWVLGLPTKTWTIVMFIALGAIGLPIGARLVVSASVQIAADLGVSDAVVGLTILALGTSLPELATTVRAAHHRRTEVGVGTVIGSNIFNVLGIMGVAAAVSPSPIAVPRAFFVLDFQVMLAAAVLISTFVWLRRPIGRPAGVIFVGLYAAYILALVSGVGGLER